MIFRGLVLLALGVFCRQEGGGGGVCFVDCRGDRGPKVNDVDDVKSTGQSARVVISIQ